MKTLEERFWQKVDVRGVNECWPWKGAINGGGYGYMWLSQAQGKRKAETAHRLALEYAGNPPGDFCACHHCDNKICVNPKHLYVGTPKDNVGDAWERNRLPQAPTNFGEDHPGHKLTEVDVREIRSLASSGFTQKAIAEIYGIDASAVSLIVRRLRWPHLE